MLNYKINLFYSLMKGFKFFRINPESWGKICLALRLSKREHKYFN